MASKSRKRPHGRAARRPRRRLRLSWLIGAAVIIAAGGFVVLVVVQGGGSSNGDSAAEAERNDDPGLPGLYINIPEIYEGSYPHVSVAVDYEAAGNSNPPVGGPHWGGAACGDEPDEAPPFCGPAPWGIFLDPWDAETLVHNMEHAGVVVWYKTDDQAVVDELTALVNGHLDDEQLIVMAPYRAMEDEQIAITSWTRIDKFPVSEYDAERVDDFIDTHMRRFNPEGF